MADEPEPTSAMVRTPTVADALPPQDTLDQLRDALEQSRASKEIIEALGREGDSSGRILDTIVERSTRLCRADAGQLYLLEGDVFRQTRTWGVSAEFREYIRGHPVQLSRSSLLGRVALDRRTQQIADVMNDPEYGRRDLAQVGGIRTLLAAPMLLGDEVVGAISIFRTSVAPFSDREMEMLDDFAAQAAVALRQVDLMASLEQRSTELASKVEQLEGLGELGEAVSSSLDPDEVLERIVTSAVRLAGTDGGSIMEYDDHTDAFVVRAAHGTSTDLLGTLRRLTIHRRSTLVGRAATERRPVAVSDLQAADLDPHLAALLADGWRSLLAVPMLRADLVVGVLNVRRRSPGGFPDDLVEVLQTFASQSSVAIVNARLFRELETKSAELEVASRHKSEFLASMSHELRTPLNAVIGFSEVLLDRMFGELNDRQDEYVRDIWNSGRHLLELLNEVLDLSKVEAGQMTLEPATFRVADVLDHALSLVRERATAHGIALGLQVHDEVGSVHADELRFKQVVLNLLSNAVKFTPDGGRVDVEARTVGDELVVTVKDTGVGIPPEDRERIFESFQQGGRGVAREEGTGLGLTLSRRIVELFGGRLWLESELGSGSTFGFAIPVRPGESRGPTFEQVGESAPTVLIVDDDRASVDLMSAYLSGSAVRVERAADGDQAVALTRSLRPAAVLLDIKLPRRDGWQVLADLRDDPATAQVPVVVASVVDDRARGLGLGAADYLIKPVSRDDLLRALERVGLPLAPLSLEADGEPT